MKKIFFMSIAILLSASSQASSPAIGGERMEPVFYPKFSLMSSYSFSKRFHLLGENSLKYQMPNVLDAALSYEAGLYRYFNAGAVFGARIPMSRDDPLAVKMMLFAKPLYALTGNFAVFSRISAGLQSSNMSDDIYYLSHINQEAQKAFENAAGDFQRVSDTHPFGTTTSASIGLEYFPLSRIGLSVEAAIRADVYWILLESPYDNRKSSSSYVTYDFPVMATLHFIF